LRWRAWRSVDLAQVGHVNAQSGKLIDGAHIGQAVENRGPSRGSGAEWQAARLAARFELPGGAGSAAHDPEGIGAAYLEMPDFDGPAEFLAAMRKGEVRGEYRPHAVRYARRQP